MFEIREHEIDPAGLKSLVWKPSFGGYVSFEGWVRDHHHGRAVTGLRYTDYRALALKEGGRIIDEAREKWPGTVVACVHRVGMLEIGGLAVWVGAASAHREVAFAACRYVLDEVKSRVPIWKEEYYADGSREWVACNDGCEG